MTIRMRKISIHTGWFDKGCYHLGISTYPKTNMISPRDEGRWFSLGFIFWEFSVVVAK